MWGKAHDVRRFHPPSRVFEGVIGGPPCQAHSRLASVVQARYGPGAVATDFIPEFARVVSKAQPVWFLMENVPDAPSPEVPGYAIHSFTLNLRHLDAGNGVGYVQHRRRRFWFGILGKDWVDLRPHLNYAVLENPDFAPAVLASGLFRGRKRGHIRLRAKRGPSRATVREALQLQGLPEDFFQGTPFTVSGQQRLIGNAVPLPMARALARAIRHVVAETRSNVDISIGPSPHHIPGSVPSLGWRPLR